MVFLFTILLAICFTFFQAYEYLNAPFNISDSVYGSTFYMATWVSRATCYYRYFIYLCVFC